MKKIILHCGMRKTGSSALQVQLSQSRETLLQFGFDYIRMGGFALAEQGKISSGNCVALAQSYGQMRGDRNVERRKKTLSAAVKAIRAAEGHVIFSTEFFSTLPVQNLAKLVDELSAEGDVQLVFFTREQTSFLVSDYVQKIKRHGLQQFPDEYFPSWEKHKNRLMYFSHFTKLSHAMPDVKISIQPYELSKTHPSGLMGMFLDMIGAQVPKEGLASDAQINLSPSPMEIRLMMEINKHGPRMKFSDMLVESSHKAGRAKIHSQQVILPPRFKQEIVDFFHDDNEEFFKHFVGGENLYQLSENGDEFVDLSKIRFEASDVVDILSGLLVDIDRRVAKIEAAL